MKLFGSKFPKLEAFVNAKPDERTPAMLAEVQAEMDAMGAKVIMVPHSEGVTSPATLQASIDALKTAATTANEAKVKAENDVKELRGTRVVDDARQTSDKKEAGDKDNKVSEAEATAAVVNNPEHPWNATADRMGFTVETKKPETEAKA